jgi:hypothetical protein
MSAKGMKKERPIILTEAQRNLPPIKFWSNEELEPKPCKALEDLLRGSCLESNFIYSKGHREGHRFLYSMPPSLLFQPEEHRRFFGRGGFSSPSVASQAVAATVSLTVACSA